MIPFSVVEKSLRLFQVCATILLPTAWAVGGFERKPRQGSRRKEVDYAYGQIVGKSDPYWLS